MTNHPLSADLRSPELTHATAEVSDREYLDRFVRRHDQAAFAALVRRHGPMVQGVCERLLHHRQDAEDAFQATFLVLVRKAGSLQKPELLGNWLYGVAFRTACKARSLAGRREHYERQAAAMPDTSTPYDPSWREMRSVLDEELQALPFKYRAPLVLCYLEGMTNEEAALRLGWPIGSMSYRLSRGRELLRGRLNRRNSSHALPAGMFALFLQQSATSPQVEASLVQATTEAALGLAKGATAGLSANAHALAEQTLRTLAAAGRRSLPLATAIVLIVAFAVAVVAAFGIGYNTNPPWPHAPEGGIQGGLLPSCNNMPMPKGINTPAAQNAPANGQEAPK